MKKTEIDIKGMHCKSCEMLIEEELLKIPGVKKACVNQKKGKAEIYYKGILTYNEVDEAVQEAGYALGKDTKPFFSQNPQDYKEVAIAILVIFIIGTLSYLNSWFQFEFSGLSDYTSLPIVFLIGITAGISTCMALVGGLVLGTSARFAEKHPLATPLEKFKPHMYFNIGRISSFFILGGLIGYLGSFFRFSSGTLGFLIVLVGIVMLFLGLQLTQLFPRLSSMSFTLPKGLSNLLGIKTHNEKEYSHKNAVALGTLTFFLPCGFTQAMQLYAMSTGSIAAGALTMGVFALGTTPGLLSIGGLTSIVKGAFARAFFKFAGVVVIILAIFNISSGLTLSGIKGISLSFPTSQANSTSTANAEIITATYDATNGFQPKQLTVKVGTPTRLEVDAKDNGYGCMGSITIPGLAQNVEVFKKGTITTFEFTVQSAGDYNITCAMGLPHGTIKAI